MPSVEPVTIPRIGQPHCIGHQRGGTSRIDPVGVRRHDDELEIVASQQPADWPGEAWAAENHHTLDLLGKRG
jgi:hypothetical protein